METERGSSGGPSKAQDKKTEGDERTRFPKQTIKPPTSSMRIAKKTAAAAAAKESDNDETTKGPNKDDTDSTKVSLASLHFGRHQELVKSIRRENENRQNIVQISE